MPKASNSSLTTTLFLFLSFSIIAQDFKDCNQAFPICSLGDYHFEEMLGYGNIQTLDEDFSCFNDLFKETNSTWLKFKSSKPGTITFTLSPMKAEDDLDFVLFKMDDDCQSKRPVRCMGSGETVGIRYKSSNAPCIGNTGLSMSSVDEFESTGCKFKDDNFLKYLQVEEGEEYVLMINNFKSGEGFSMTIEGSAELKEYPNCQQITSTTEEYVEITQLYPNPTIDEIILDFQSNSSETVLVEIFDFTGRRYQSRNHSAFVGMNRITFNVSDLPQSSYLIKLKQGGFSTSKQFVKQ